MRSEKVVDELVSSIYKKYRANDHKGETWKEMSTDELNVLLMNEAYELMEDVLDGKDGAMDEAADVAIFAAFIASKERIRKDS